MSHNRDITLKKRLILIIIKQMSIVSAFMQKIVIKVTHKNNNNRIYLV